MHEVSNAIGNITLSCALLSHSVTETRRPVEAYIPHSRLRPCLFTVATQDARPWCLTTCTPDRLRTRLRQSPNLPAERVRIPTLYHIKQLIVTSFTRVRLFSHPSTSPPWRAETSESRHTPLVLAKQTAEMANKRETYGRPCWNR
jgi:hypothetical protein